MTKRPSKAKAGTAKAAAPSTSTTASSSTATTASAAAVLLARLKRLGVDIIFANSGTDFPPLIEALASAPALGLDMPRALVMPHEHAAMGMAYGYYLGSGRPQAVMLHTNVGLANAATGAINLAAEHIPALIFSGRTPVVEAGRFGARTVPISWGQEMRDQSALIREAAKWDYELRFPEQAIEVADRALAISMSTPKGPVYVSLPREVLCEPCPTDDLADRPLLAPAIAGPSRNSLMEAAELLVSAKSPVAFAQRGAGDAAGFAALSAMASALGLPVVQYWANQLAIGTGHPMHAGMSPLPWLAEADVVLVIDALAPWSPDIHRPRSDARIIQLGPDPLEARTPIRNFRADVAIAGETGPALVELWSEIERRLAVAPDRHRLRAHAVAERNAARRREVEAQAATPTGAALSKAQVAVALSNAIVGRRATVLSELGCPLEPMRLDHAGSWYQEPYSGGLGWSFPTAMGLKLADPDRLVVATMGDGSYMFANPVVCHQIAESLALPIVILILNNAAWGAVQQSVVGLYPDGRAANANAMPLTSLAPIPDFSKVAEASRAWARRVTTLAELEAALEAALAHVDAGRSAALIDIVVS